MPSAEPVDVCIWCGGPSGLAGAETGPCASCGRHLGSKVSGSTTIAELMARLPADGVLQVAFAHLDDAHDAAIIAYQADKDAEPVISRARWER